VKLGVFIELLKQIYICIFYEILTDLITNGNNGILNLLIM